MSGYLEKLAKGEGFILYCPDCNGFIQQSDPQNDSRRKSVVINDEPCFECKETRAQEVIEAQHILGRLGLPKENTDEQS